MLNIASRLKKLRKEHSLTQKEVAASLEINERTYRRYEAGDIEPSATSIYKLAEFFNISADYLLGLSDDPELH